MKHNRAQAATATAFAISVLAWQSASVELQGQTWTQLNPTGSFPVAGAGESSAGYDPNGGRFIIFGGGETRTNNVYVLSNAAGAGGTPVWTMLSPLGTAPAPRANSALVYDGGSNRLIVFGGANGNLSTYVSYNDVWVLTNADGLESTPPQWIELSPSGTPPAPRASLSAIFDPSSNRMTIFGGCTHGPFGCDVPQNDTWVLTNATGLGGTPTWIELNPTGSLPGPRDAYTASFDPTTKNMIVFGGGGGNTGVNYGDVWILQNANGLGSTTPHWTNLIPTGAATPGTRYNHATAYNPAANQLFIFGGVSSGAEKNDTWVLSHANGLGGSSSWTQLSPSGGPPSAREGQSSAFDPYLNRMIVFGGDNLTDTWVLTPSSAAFAGLDTATEGTWTSKYGSNGEVIANDVNNPPAYATVSLAGDSVYTWAASTTDVRALQTSSGASTRIASTYYSSGGFMVNLNLTDGNTHRISLYLVDWDSTSRTETISILDASTNAVLDTETFSSFHNGEYAEWDVQGHVLIQVTKTGGANAVVSGIFFD